MIKSRKKSELKVEKVVIYLPEIAPYHELESGLKFNRRRGDEEEGIYT